MAVTNAARAAEWLEISQQAAITGGPVPMPVAAALAQAYALLALRETLVTSAEQLSMAIDHQTSEIAAAVALVADGVRKI